MRYRVHFTLEGAVEVNASCADEAEEIVDRMDRNDLLGDYEEHGFSMVSSEMEEE
jgi:hypothetical protein|nr:MAG TPA: hypothetical protein [Caudoviricetes sp.]